MKIHVEDAETCTYVEVISKQFYIIVEEIRDPTAVIITVEQHISTETKSNRIENEPAQQKTEE